MNNLPIHPASDLTKYIVSSTNEIIVFHIPHSEQLILDMDLIKQFEDIRSVTENTEYNYQEIILEFKTNHLSACGRVMHYY